MIPRRLLDRVQCYSIIVGLCIRENLKLASLFGLAMAGKVEQHVPKWKIQLADLNSCTMLLSLLFPFVLVSAWLGFFVLHGICFVSNPDYVSVKRTAYTNRDQ